jgi:hypothetical protein
MTILTNIFDYGFWVAIIICLCIIDFPEFQFDFFHVILTIVIVWLSVSLILLKKLTSSRVNFTINHSPISFLKEKFPGTYIKKTGNKTFEINGHFGLFFGRRRITILIEKDCLNINILTIVRFDIPSAFHAIPNFIRSKKLANELVNF